MTSEKRHRGRPRTTPGDTRPVSFYVDKASVEALDSRSACRTGRSSALRRVLLRYRALMHRYRPDFSIGEWRLIVGAFAGMPTEYETSFLGATLPDLKQVLSRAVHATALEGAETAIGVDRLRLLGRIGNLNDAEAAAVIDVVERFLSGAPKNELAAVPEAIQRILATPYA